MAQITCKEIDEYIEYAKKHPKWINKDRKLLINNIVKPLLKRKDVYFDEATFRLCIKFCEANYYTLLPFQKFIYAMVFFYTDETIFHNIIIQDSKTAEAFVNALENAAAAAEKIAPRKVSSRDL